MYVRFKNKEKLLVAYNSTTRFMAYEDFFFFARYNVFCDQLQFKSTKNETFLFSIIKNV